MTKHFAPSSWGLDNSMKPREFEPGFSTSYFGLQTFLAGKGFELSRVKNRFTLKKHGEPGRSKVVHWGRVIDIVDGLRIADGLMPIRRRG